MTSRLDRTVRSARSSLLLIVVIAAVYPGTAWLQEQTGGAPAQTPQQPAAQSGTLALTASAAAAEQQGQYTIKEGDTLWDIAGAHYRDPFLWPLIWKSNPSIADPDLIYPGTVLVIPSLAPVERAMSAPEEPAPVQEKVVTEKAPEPAPAPPQTAPEGVASFFRKKLVEMSGPEPEPQVQTSRFVAPKDERIPIFDRYAMISAGFVSYEDTRDTVLGQVEELTRGGQGSYMAGTGQQVFISIKSREQVNVGEQFLIFHPEHTVKHPVSRRVFGQLNHVRGVLKVIAAHEKNVYTADIVMGFDAVVPGDLLLPYQEPALLYPEGQRPAKNLGGFVLETTDRKTISGQVDVVYLDKGKIDGVEPGDRFTVYLPVKSDAKIPQVVGEVQVVLVKERTATALVRKSVQEISPGYPVTAQ